MPVDPLTIVFAIVAAVAAWKLYGVLGQTSGFQRQRPSADLAPREPARGDTPASNVVRLPGAPPANDSSRWAAFMADAGAARGLDAIAAAEPSFAPAAFLGGARSAYETVLTAFAEGDRATLRSLLAPDVFDGFIAALTAREEKNERLETTLVSIDDARIASAELAGSTARLGVRFLSKQISASYDSAGQSCGGNPDRVAELTDLWTFARQVHARDPNWKLVATEAGR